MGRNGKKWFLALSLIFFLVILLVACGNTATQETETEKKPVETLQVYQADGSFFWTIMRPDACSKAVTNAAADIRVATLAVTNLGKVGIMTDYTRLPATDPSITEPYEILVGRTNRLESKEVFESLSENEYAIRHLNHKIVIVGADDEATVKAAEVFMSEILKYKGEGETYDPAALEIPADLNILREYTTEEREARARAEWEAYVASAPRVESKAQIIQTKYPTNDIVIADFVATDFAGVDPTGQTDSTAGIQKALSTCSQYGGGTVWLPEGKYLVTKKITIPFFVTLRGDWNHPDKVTDGLSYGTVILAKPESKDAMDDGLFILNGSSGAVGLTIYYPDQSLTDVKPYPHTFYVPTHMLPTVSHVTFLNAYRGVGACYGSDAHEQLTLEEIYGTFLSTGFALYNSSDVGTVTTVHMNASYWANTKLGQAPTQESIQAYNKANTIGMRLGDLEWTEFSNIYLDGFQYAVYIERGFRATFAGSFYDLYVTDCVNGVYITHMDDRWGAAFARSSIEASDKALYNGTEGYVKCTDLKIVNGAVEGKNIQDYWDDTSLQDNVIDYERTYVKPAAKLYIAPLFKAEDIDCSQVLQDTLNEAGKTGGVVYVPAGKYLFEKAVIVPANVELRGASSVANRCQNSSSDGTVFYVKYGTGEQFDADKDPAFLTLSGENSGLNGIRILFIDNGLINCPTKKVNSVFAIRGTAKGVYVVNSGAVAAAYGVDFRNCDNHFIKKFVGWCYFNLITAGGKNGMIQGNLSNATVMLRTATVIKNWEGFNSGGDYAFGLSRNNLDLIVLTGAKNETVWSTFCYGCSTLVKVINSEDVLVVNIGADNIGENSYQLDVVDSNVTVICVMRYNGSAFRQSGGFLCVYSRLAIWEPKEMNYEKFLS